MEAGGAGDHGAQQPNATILCAKGCGFFGSPATMNMCSKCFREHHKPQQPQRQHMAKTSGPSPTAPEVVKREPMKDEGDEELVTKEEAGPVDQGPKRKVQKNKGRCFSCRKKVGLTGFECKCGYVYCGEHRYSDKHQCDFDYKSSAREQLTKANPVVVASKLEKI